MLPRLTHSSASAAVSLLQRSARDLVGSAPAAQLSASLHASRASLCQHSSTSNSSVFTRRLHTSLPSPPWARSTRSPSLSTSSSLSSFALTPSIQRQQQQQCLVSRNTVARNYTSSSSPSSSSSSSSAATAARLLAEESSQAAAACESVVATASKIKTTPLTFHEEMTKVRFSYNWWKEWTIIMGVFAVTGSSTVMVVKPLLKDVLKMDGSMKEGPWSFRIVYLITTLPLYSCILLTVATVAGRRPYFKVVVLRMWGRFLPKKVLQRFQ